MRKEFINTEFNELSLLAQELEETGNYDVDMLISSIKHMLKENNFFYGVLAKRNPEMDPGRVFYDLKENTHEHQLVYVQLGAGYAKELRGPHWCYILKQSGQKLSVIPVTSVKPSSGRARFPYEFDIEEEGKVAGRLHFDDIRSIDKMRIVEKKGYREVITSKEAIVEAYRKYMEI